MKYLLKKDRPFLYIMAIDDIGPCRIGDIFKVSEIGCLDFIININGKKMFFDESFFIYHHPVKLHNRKHKRKIGKKYKKIIKEYHKNNGAICQLAGCIKNKQKFINK